MGTWQKPETIAFWIIIIICVVLLLNVMIFLLIRINSKRIIISKEKENQLKLEHQKKLLRNSIETQETERKRIAADIHDELIGKLTALKFSFEILGYQNDDILNTLDLSIQTARRISHDLTPPLLEYNSLPELLNDLCSSWNDLVSIQFEIIEEKEFDKDYKTQIIRILQEIIMNTIKHAQASSLEISYYQDAHTLNLKTSDNGIGFNIEDKRTGIGLSNIETRVEALSGQLNISSEIGQGTIFNIVFNL